MFVLLFHALIIIHAVFAVTPQDVYLALTGSKFKRLAECFDDNKRCYIQNYGIFGYNNITQTVDSLLYSAGGTIDKVVIAVSEDSSRELKTDITNCDQYANFIDSLYIQPYDDGYDYCFFASNSTPYKRLALQLTPDNETLADGYTSIDKRKRDDIEEECIEEISTDANMCKLVVDNCVECFDMGGLGHDNCMFELSFFSATGILEVCKYWLNYGLTISSKCTLLN